MAFGSATVWWQLLLESAKMGLVAYPREDVDLHLHLSDPENAREFIKNYDWGQKQPPKFIAIDDSVFDLVFFDRMSDHEAVAAAHAILRIYEIPMAWNQAQSGTVEIH